MQTVAVVGVGLIGGSFALALRKAGFQGRIVGVSSPITIEAALRRGVIDGAGTLEQALSEADLVYLAQPIHRILQTIEELDRYLRPGALVTDAGSTKARIVAAARAHIQRGQFLGGHPMAGKEKRGVEEAEPDLFAGRTYVLTPASADELETPAARELVAWIRRIGASPVVLGPEEHDRVVALTSHLPQLASTALAAALARKLAQGQTKVVTGPGLLDMTRLALSPHEIWKDILETNTDEIEHALDLYIAQLSEVRRKLRQEGLGEEFRLAADFASRIRSRA